MPITDSLLSFPCDFPLKVIGRRNDDFRSLALGIVQKHVGTIPPEQITERPSKDGNYLSLTCTFQASSRAQLDALYAELTACERVLIVL
jgi:putative lipoic acid-binding regulatory protein